MKQPRSYPRPAKCSPFRVLAEVQVWKGRRDSSIVVGRLEPGEIVWANQQKGCMLRVVRTDRWGKIRRDRSLKPESWGWVSMRRKSDGKQQLKSIVDSMPNKVYGGDYGYQEHSRCFQNQLWPHPQLTASAENHTFDIASLKHIQEFKPRRACNTSPHDKRVNVFPSPTTNSSRSLSPMNTHPADKREGMFVSSMSSVSPNSSANAASLEKLSERSKVLRFSLGGHEAELSPRQEVSVQED